MNKGTGRSFDTCRACLVFSNDTYQIFDDIPQMNISIATMLNYCFLEVQEEDNFPKAFCSKCFAELQTAYHFIKTFKKSQELLDKCLAECNGKIIVVDESEMSEFNNANNVEEIDMEVRKDSLSNFEPSESAVDIPAEDATESFIIRYDSSQGDGSDDSNDQNFLIEQSVKLTQHYKLHKLDENYCDESNTEDEAKEQHTPCEESSNENEDHKILTAENSSLTTKGSYCSILACPLCSKTFRKYAAFGSHLKQHNRKIPCNVCFMEFTDVDVYIGHYQMKHKYQCEICHQSFPRGDTLNRHMQVHNNTLPRFVCPIENCSRSFLVKQSLKNHYKTVHSENRNFLCNLCGASFKNYGNLRYHLKKHKGPSHLCTYCGRVYMQAVHLKCHMWRHTGVKPYKCSNCDKSFVTKRILTVHQRKSCGLLRRTCQEDFLS